MDKANRLRSSMSGIFDSLMEIIYPPRCYICNTFLREGVPGKGWLERHFCRTCMDDFSEIETPFCTTCGRPFASLAGEDHICEDCIRENPFYDMICVPYLYQGSIMTAIHQFKYAGKSQLADSLGPLMTASATKLFDNMNACLLMPVPLHPKRLRERGFNQGLLLTRNIAFQKEKEVDFLSLRRTRYTLPQTGLNSKERRKNVRGAFEVTDKKGIQGRSIVLVDDVATTGNTLNECARVLKRAGCDKVFCMVLARTSGM